MEERAEIGRSERRRPGGAPRWRPRSGPVLPLLGLLAVFSAGATAQECTTDELPAVLPVDAMLFLAEVIEPVVEESDPPATRVAIFGWETIPLDLQTVDLVLTTLDTDCSAMPLTRQELIERFVSTERIRVAARESHLQGARLEVPARWVSSGEAQREQVVQDVFDYFGALARLERTVSDSERVPALRSIAEYVSDEELFRAVTERYLESKRLQKQVIAMQRSFHATP